MQEIDLLRQENIAMRECITDVLIRFAGYDGYHTADDLKRLIDFACKTLESKYPERVFNEIEGEVCPLCFKPKDDTNAKQV
jgi:hypothetical protein